LYKQKYFLNSGSSTSSKIICFPVTPPDAVALHSYLFAPAFSISRAKPL